MPHLGGMDQNAEVADSGGNLQHAQPVPCRSRARRPISSRAGRSAGRRETLELCDHCGRDRTHAVLPTGIALALLVRDRPAVLRRRFPHPLFLNREGVLLVRVRDDEQGPRRVLRAPGLRPGRRHPISGD